MMKTRLFSLVSAVVATTLSVLSARAADVTPEQASLAAQRWVARSGEFAASFGKAVSTVTKETVQGTSFYVAKMQGGGVIVLASDTTRRPVIFALPGAEFQAVEANPAVKLLAADLKRMPSEKAAAANEAAWRKLTSTGPSLMSTSAAAPSDLRVDGLVATHWSQNFDLSNNFCYDYYTPPIWKDGIEGGVQVRSCDVMEGNYTTGNSTHTPAGCVPVAVAQIMNYFEYPAAYPNYTRQGMLLENPNDHYEDITLVNAGQAIPWSLMLDEPGKSGVTTTDANRQAIGALCFNVGLAGACSIYGWAGSSGGDICAAFRVFGYSNAEEFGGEAATLQRIIRANLNAKRPLFIGIPGHAIVCDGYGYQGGDLYLRLNMGWSWSEHCWYSQPADDAEPVIEGGVGNIYTTEPANRVILSGRVTGGAATVTAVDAADPSKTYTGTPDAKGVYALLVPPGTYLTYIKVADSYSSAKAVLMAAGIAGDVDDCDFTTSAADKASAPEVLGVPAGYTRADCVKNMGDTVVTVGGQTLAPGQKVAETLAVNGAVTAAFIPVRRTSDGASGFVDSLTGTFFTDAAFISRLPGEGFALPGGCIALEYIESTGEQYINTGYTLRAADKIECVVNVPQGQLANPNAALYGTSFGWAYGCRTFLVKQNGNVVCSYDIVPWEGGYGNYVSGEGFYGRKVSLTDVNGNLTWTALDDSGCSGRAASLYGAPSDAYNSLLILDHNTIGDYGDKVANAALDGNWASAVAKLYSFTITDANGNKLRDYMPCQNSDGTVGLWDKAEGAFVTSATGVAFRPPLPAGYEEVEYIRSTFGGNQYINTQYNHTLNTRVVCTFKAPTQSQGNFAAAFGSHNGQGPLMDQGWIDFQGACDFYLKWWGNDYPYLGYGYGDWYDNLTYLFYCRDFWGADFAQSSYYQGLDLELNQRQTIDCRPASVVLNGGTHDVGTAGQSVSDIPLYVFGANHNGSMAYPAVMNLYGFKIYEGDVLARDFVPCRNAEGVAGLYDFVTKAFYGNANTAADAVPFYTVEGPFPLPSSYTAVDCIESDGTQFINTGYKLKQTDSVEGVFQIDPNMYGGDANHGIPLFGTAPIYADGMVKRYVMCCWPNGGAPGYALFYGTGNTTDDWSHGWDVNAVSHFGEKMTIACTGNTMTWSTATATGTANATKNISDTATDLFIFDFSDVYNGSYIADYAGGGVGGWWTRPKARLYSFTITDANGSKVRDYVPCRKPDGTAGLWDKVNGQFYGSPVGNAFAVSYSTLPDGYAALEYIESTADGNQYIDTGYTHTFYSRVVCDMRAPKSQPALNYDWWNQHALFGSQITGDALGGVSYAYTFYLGWWGQADGALFTHWSFYGGYSGNDNPTVNQFSWSNNFPLEQRVSIDCQCADDGQFNPSATVTPNGPSFTIYGIGGNWGNGQCPMYVFAADYNNAPTCYSVMRLYGFKIYEGAMLKRDLVPCRNPDGVAGLFDMAYGKFYSSPNGVPFIGSDEIPLPADDITIRVPADFFDGKTVAGEPVATLAQRQAYLYAAEANGLKAWQNYAMGVDGATAANAFDIIYTKTSETSIALSTPIPAFNPPAGSGLAVTYMLMKSTDGGATWSEVATGLSTPTVSLPVAEIGTGDSLWKFKAVFAAP